MVSEDNLKFLRQDRRRYIVGTPKSMLKQFEQELLKDDWHTIRDGLEVKPRRRPCDEDEASPTVNRPYQLPMRQKHSFCAGVGIASRKKTPSCAVSKRRSRNGS